MAYSAIGDHGLLGNLRTAALVDTRGTVDWLCLPAFDGPSVFASLLDDKKGGSWSVQPEGHFTTRQYYWPDSNILVTRLNASGGVVELIDFMPVPMRAQEPTLPQMVRICRGMSGKVALRMHCHPAPDYARAPCNVDIRSDDAVFTSPGCSLGLSSSAPLQLQNGGATALLTLEEGQSAVFALTHLGATSTLHHLELSAAWSLFDATLGYWRRWLSRCTYRGRWREMVERSALVLKLLTYEPTGAVVAAPTCSLPAPPGGERNWDYRYTWIRDAAFTLYGLMRVGFTDEAVAFMHWLSARCQELPVGKMLQPLYGIDGRSVIDEFTLDHLDGHLGSRPVRVGNAAYQQLQMDVPGELLDSVYLYNKYAEPVSHDLWVQLQRILEWVCVNWKMEDKGVWEVRGPSRNFVYSRMMCWVALDRGIRLAQKRSFPADTARWHRVRDEIYNEIMDKGFSPVRNAFVQRYGSTTLDASNLCMPLVFFVGPTDPRMLGTLDAVMQPPSRGGLTRDVQVMRYLVEDTEDGLTGDEGGFNICTFWLIEALTRAGRFDRLRLEQARVLFEKMLACSNHVGLYAEQTGPRGEPQGNFPQAFTHLSFISAAYNLDRALGGK